MKDLLKKGTMSGIIGGIIFLSLVMMLRHWTGGAESTLTSFRLISSVLLGEQALSSGFPLGVAVITGIIVHGFFSILFGIVFSLISTNRVFDSTFNIVLGSTIYGFALWVLNFYIFAPLLGFVWLPQETNPLIQVMAHTFFYGSILGLYISYSYVTHKSRLAYH